MEKSGQIRNAGMMWFLVNLIFGLYLLNYGFNFVNISFITDSINKWIIVIGGGLIIIHGVTSLVRRPTYPQRYR